MRCVDCAYYWKNDDEKYAHCHYEYDDGQAPCELDDPTYETEDFDE